MDHWDSAAERGTCPECLRDGIALRRNGTLWRHAGKGRGSSFLPERENRCPGSGKSPKEG